MGLANTGDRNERDALVKARFGIAQTSKASEDQLEVQRLVQSEVQQLASLLIDEVAPSRELSLALTHLEETLMWAGKAIFN